MSKRKIDPSEYAKIRELVGKGVSKLQIAKLYGVTWGTIQFIIEPEKAELNRQRMKERQAKLRDANESRNGDMNCN